MEDGKIKFSVLINSDVNRYSFIFDNGILTDISMRDFADNGSTEQSVKLTYETINELELDLNGYVQV